MSYIELNVCRHVTLYNRYYQHTSGRRRFYRLVSHKSATYKSTLRSDTFGQRSAAAAASTCTVDRLSSPFRGVPKLLFVLRCFSWPAAVGIELNR